MNYKVVWAIAIAAPLFLAACSEEPEATTDKPSVEPIDPPTTETPAAASQYQVPENAVALIVPNADFEAPFTDVGGWRQQQHVGEPAYTMDLDAEAATSGQQSFRMTRIAPQVYGWLNQKIDLKDAAGKTLVIRADMKSSGVGPSGWVMVVNFLGATNRILKQVRSDKVTGDTDWHEVVISHPVPKATAVINLGPMLLDEGTGWVDNVEVFLVDKQ